MDNFRGLLEDLFMVYSQMYSETGEAGGLWMFAASTRGMEEEFYFAGSAELK